MTAENNRIDLYYLYLDKIIRILDSFREEFLFFLEEDRTRHIYVPQTFPSDMLRSNLIIWSIEVSSKDYKILKKWMLSRKDERILDLRLSKESCVDIYVHMEPPEGYSTNVTYKEPETVSSFISNKPETKVFTLNKKTMTANFKNDEVDSSNLNLQTKKQNDDYHAICEKKAHSQIDNLSKELINLCGADSFQKVNAPTLLSKHTLAEGIIKWQIQLKQQKFFENSEKIKNWSKKKRGDGVLNVKVLEDQILSIHIKLNPPEGNFTKVSDLTSNTEITSIPIPEKIAVDQTDQIIQEEYDCRARWEYIRSQITENFDLKPSSFSYSVALAGDKPKASYTFHSLDISEKIHEFLVNLPLLNGEEAKVTKSLRGIVIKLRPRMEEVPLAKKPKQQITTNKESVLVKSEEMIDGTDIRTKGILIETQKEFFEALTRGFSIFRVKTFFDLVDFLKEQDTAPVETLPDDFIFSKTSEWFSEDIFGLIALPLVRQQYELKSFLSEVYTKVGNGEIPYMIGVFCFGDKAYIKIRNNTVHENAHEYKIGTWVEIGKFLIAEKNKII